MSRLSSALPAVAGAIAGGAVAIAIAGGGNTKTVTTTVVAPSGANTSVPTSLTKTQSLTVNQIYRNTIPGVVDITVTSQSSSGPSFFGNQGSTQQTQGEGAGVVYDTKGDILTDQHVVAGATSVTVHFHDGHSASAKVLGQDPSSDVAVIRVNVPASWLHPVPFADSAQAQVGDPVVAIGSPFSLPGTVTTGIVSAVGRSITAPNNYTIPGAIQTDAAINPGNSGGPLLDASGHVLGLNDQIQTNSGSSAGVGFATPSNSDRRVADTIIAGKTVQHAYVGVDLLPNSPGGAQIRQVQGNSPASSAGLQPGDTVTAIDGKAIGSTEGFIATIDTYSPGTTVTMTLNRNGVVKHVKVTLGNRPATSPAG
jgi:S1-C subfamily serine protease